ncbi:MAG: hypothetical protein JO339_18645 [Alphaproteobacteria bacterium]|nr:hypothetical protein [Alphaproteobacteria bacterium]
MRPASLLLPALLLAAMPAAAQSRLAQQCAAFGEVLYRKLSPSIDKVTALDFPPPALERLDAKAGAQAVSSALTLRGRLTYRNGPPFETQFVCLLDAAHQPLFFYALPTLAARAAPTPSVRGAPVPAVRGEAATPTPPLQAPILPLGRQEPAPSPAAVEAPRPVLPASAVRLRGLVRDLGGRLQFLPCDGGPLALEDRTPDQELSKTLAALTASQPGRPMFIELYGGRETGPGAGISAVELRRAAVETAGCRERFDQREWLAMSGGDVPWRLEVTAHDILLSIAGGAPALRLPHAGPQKIESGVAYAAADDPELNVTITEQRCIDPHSGSLFAYAVEVHSEGRAFAGCAVHNPAMPAP